MRLALPLGWLQLKHKPLRLGVAILGIAFAVLLILMQLSFRSALFESAVRLHERLRYDVALFSTDSVFIVRPQPFSIRRLYQALAVAGVEQVSPVYIFPAVWKHPWSADRRSINAMGIRAEHDILDAPGFSENLHHLRQQDVVLFDARSRPEFGPVAAAIERGEPVSTEINDRAIDIAGVFALGTSFGIDGTVITSDDNWLRLFPDRPRNDIELGLIHIAPGADPIVVRDALRNLLPDDVLVMTRQDFVDRETAYWNAATPIGYIFAFGAIMGFVVGCIVVYQILFADVSDHLEEYATLRAIGYRNRFISGIVVQQALILALLGFIPGALASRWLCSRAAAATNLPLYLTADRLILVFALTLAMCAFSGLLALRKVRRLDPAEVF